MGRSARRAPHRRMKKNAPIVDDESLPDRSAWPKQMAELADVLLALFLKRKCSTEESISAARAVVLELAFYFGGRPLYIPRGDRLRIAQRNAEIWARFNGGNVVELAEEFQVTSIHLYSILAEQRALRTRPLDEGKS